mgnify:CR=1 FL=1
MDAKPAGVGLVRPDALVDARRLRGRLHLVANALHAFDVSRVDAQRHHLVTGRRQRVRGMAELAGQLNALTPPKVASAALQPPSASMAA